MGSSSYVSVLSPTPFAAMPRWVRRLLTRLFVKGSTLAVENHYKRRHACLPEHRVGNIRIHGDPLFQRDIAEALAQLEQRYPYGYRLVCRYIRAFVQIKTKSRSEGWPAIVYRKISAEGQIGVAPNRFAAALVRASIVNRKFSGFCIWQSTESELHSLKHELRAMEMLGCDRKYFHRVQNEIFKRERLLK